VKIKLLIVYIFSTLLFGCASPNMRLSQLSTDEIKPNANKALVNFIRPSKKGFAINAAVYDGDKLIGFVPYGQRLPYLASPGEHTFMVISESADFMKADLLAGKTYYAKVVPRMGLWRARFSLLPVSRADLESSKVQKFIKESRLIKNKEDANKWDKKNRNSVLKKQKAYFSKWQKKAENKRPYLRAEDGQ